MAGANWLPLFRGLMTVPGQNFEMHVGDTKEIRIPVYDENDELLDLSPYSEAVWVVYHPTTKDAVLTKTLGAGITFDGSEIVISLVPSDTVNIIPKLYNHECEISDGGPVVVTTTTGTVKMVYSKA